MEYEKEKSTMTGKKIQYPIIDIHSHVLPGIDDGARTMEESLSLLEMAYEQGIDAVFATSHYTGCRRKTNHTEINYAELRKCLEDKIRERIPEFHIYSGRENFYHEGLTAQLRERPELYLGNGPYAMIEFEPMTSYGLLFRGIRYVIDSGAIPVLAHVERYLCLRNEDNLMELSSIGCRFQMNFDSLKGRFYSSEVRWCRKQILSGRIFALGTDMHRLDFRPPDIKEPLIWLKEHIEPTLLRKMLYENPMSILENNNQ